MRETRSFRKVDEPDDQLWRIGVRIYKTVEENRKEWDTEMKSLKLYCTSY